MTGSDLSPVVNYLNGVVLFRGAWKCGDLIMFPICLYTKPAIPYRVAQTEHHKDTHIHTHTHLALSAPLMERNHLVDHYTTPQMMSPPKLTPQPGTSAHPAIDLPLVADITVT